MTRPFLITLRHALSRWWRAWLMLVSTCAPVEPSTLVPIPSVTVETSSAGDAADAAPPAVLEPHVSGPRSMSIADVEAHIGDPSRVRWTKAATLMRKGHESCVDGRDVHAVIGTPGGDAGELLLLLAAAERHLGRPIQDAEVERLVADHLEAFGHFYMHTDDHALRGLAQGLERDDAFAGVRLDEDEAIEALVRHPPAALRAALLEHLLDPAAIGCGHLRLIRQHPEEYDVRPALLASFMSAVFHRLWDGDDALDFVVLHGDHEERAVVVVHLAGEVRPFTSVPLVVPRYGDSEMFVHHPQVASFIRRQNTMFLLERVSAAEAETVDVGDFLTHLQRLGDQQLQTTIRYLAADLPVFDVSFHGRRFSVDVATVQSPVGPTFAP